MTPSQIRRIVGCPGGGLTRKTTKLTELAARAADKYGGSNVLAVSLTKSAAAELAGKHDTVLDPDSCATLHAHALRALEFDPAKLAETPASMREFHTAHPAYASDDHRDQVEDAPVASRGPHAQVTNRRARMEPVEAWTQAERGYWATWTAWKVATGRCDFTDLVERCVHEQVPPLSRPRVILADEAQDFTALEFALLAQWAAETESTVMVGDTQQCIYSFRGADPERLEAVPVASNESLTQSYRCPRTVARAAQAWASQLPGPKVAWSPRDADGQVDEAPFALRDVPDVADAAQESVGEGQSTMVLATCRYMLAPLCHELRARGVPFANPWALTETAWNPLQGSGTRALLALLRPTLEGEGGRMWTWGDLHDLTRPMQATALPRGAKAAIEAHCMTDELGQTRSGDEVPIGTLFTLLGDAATHLLAVDRHAEQTVDWWQGTLLARHAKPCEYPARVWRARGAGALTADPMLTVGTVHSTKGAEAAHVLLAPEVSREAYNHWHDGRRDALVRTMYVAMTRARERLTIMEPGCWETLPLAEAIGAVAV